MIKRTGLALFFAIMANIAGADSAATCEGPEYAMLTNCRIAAAELQFSPEDVAEGLIACDGDCLVRSGVEIEFSDPSRPSIALDGLQLLHGLHSTLCLSSELPFLDETGQITLVDVTTERAGAMRKLELAAITVSPETTFLACDGDTLVYADSETGDVNVIDAFTQASVLSKEWLETHTILTVSDGGRFAIAVRNEDGRLVAHNIASSRDIVTEGVFELDQVFLSAEGDHLFAVMHSHSPVTTFVYDTSTGEQVATVTEALPGGLPVSARMTNKGLLINVLQTQ